MHRCQTLTGIVLILAALTVQALAQPGAKQPANPPRTGVLPLDEKSGGKPATTPMPAAQAVAELQGRSLSEWIQDLKHTDPSVREHAISALPLFGESIGIPEVVNLLIDRCSDRDASPRIRAMMVLNTMPIPPAEVSRVVKALTEKLKDQQSQMRYYAALGLIRFGEDGRMAISELARLADDPTSFEIRCAALKALIATGHNPKGPPDPRAVAAMVKASNDVALKVKLEAAMGLGMLGKTGDARLAPLVDKALINLSRDRDKRVVIWANVAAMALDKVDPAKVQGIAALLHTHDVPVRLTAANALAMVGPPAKPVLSKVLDALNDKDPTVVAAALTAIVSIGEKGPDVLGALKALHEKKEAPEMLRLLAQNVTETLTRRAPEKSKTPDTKPTTPTKKP